MCLRLSVPQLLDNVYQLVCRDKLHPRAQKSEQWIYLGSKYLPVIEILLIFMEHELDPLVPSKIRTAALVFFTDNSPLPFDTDKRFIQPEFPALEHSSIPRGCLFWEVEFETRPVEPDRLSYRPDISLF